MGISYKRWLGWTPTELDPTEWDATEREWMLALQTFDDSRICGLCGMPRDFCHDEKQVHEVFKEGVVETCFVTQMREKAVRKFEESGRVDTPNSQTTKLIPKRLTE